ncbi:hypothetical protein Taro_009276 [Colocasia esculenta]|uniref:Transposase n=1 Tax=Colocasia esculenta TaxID=4460 RepID=A0A843U4H2_COLES|nr:hypothetical protein [Colocasia esculenta]
MEAFQSTDKFQDFLVGTSMISYRACLYDYFMSRLNAIHAHYDDLNLDFLEMSSEPRDGVGKVEAPEDEVEEEEAGGVSWHTQPSSHLGGGTELDGLRDLGNEQEEVDPLDLERRVESDVEEDSQDDEDEFEDDDEDDAELNIYGTWRTESDSFYVRWPRVRDPVHDRVCLPVHVCLPIRVGRPSDRDCLPIHASHPCDRDRLPAEHASSATFPFFLITRGKIDPGSASRYITTLVHAHILGPVDAWREFPMPVRDLLFDMFTRRFAFTRPEDLPRARAVWESTAQTNLRKSMWEAREKAMKTTGNRDPMAWLDYDHVWLRRDYWESLLDRWAAGPWQQRSQAAIRNRSTHPEKNVHTSGSVSYATHSQKLHHELERAPTFRELFDRTHKRKGTNDYVSESARTIAETYDRTMAERYAEGTPQPDLDVEAWVDAAGGPRKGRVYGFGESLDTTPVLSSYASSVAPPAYASSSAAPGSGVEEIRSLIREELRAELRTELQTHFSDMVQQLISAMQGVRPSQPAPQVSISINFIYFG